MTRDADFISPFTEEIKREWEADKKSFRDMSRLHVLSMEAPALRTKYAMFHRRIRGYIVLLEEKKKRKVKELKNYYRGNYNGIEEKEKLKALGRVPFKLKLLEKDLIEHIESDDDFFKIERELEAAKMDMEMLNMILEEIRFLHLKIKNALEAIKLMGDQVV